MPHRFERGEKKHIKTIMKMKKKFFRKIFLKAIFSDPRSEEEVPKRKTYFPRSMTPLNVHKNIPLAVCVVLGCFIVFFR
jgi:hypothetical protein